MSHPAAPPADFQSNRLSEPVTYQADRAPIEFVPPPEFPVIRVFTRHSHAIDEKTGKPVCAHADDRSYAKCRCPKWIYIRHNGKNKEISAKTRSWAEAERYARELERRYDPVEQARQMVLQESQPKVKDMEEAMNDFLALWTDEEKAEQTVSKLRSTLLHRLLPWARKQNPPIIYLHQLLPEHIDQWKLQLRHLSPKKDKLQLSESSKRSERQRVITFLSYCMENRWIKENVAVSRRRIRKRLKRVEERDAYGYIRDGEGDDTLPLTPEQFDALVEAAESPKFCTPARLAAEPAVGERVKAMLYYTRYAGLRIGDAATSRKERLRADDSCSCTRSRIRTRLRPCCPTPLPRCFGTSAPAGIPTATTSSGPSGAR